MKKLSRFFDNKYPGLKVYKKVWGDQFYYQATGIIEDVFCSDFGGYKIPGKKYIPNTIQATYAIRLENGSLIEIQLTIKGNKFFPVTEGKIERTKEEYQRQVGKKVNLVGFPERKKIHWKFSTEQV